MLDRLRYVRVAAHHNVTLGPPDGQPPGLLVRQAYTRDIPKLIVYEWGIHLIGTLRMLLGEPQWVQPLPRERVPADRTRPWSPVMTTVSAVHDGDIAAAYQASYDLAQSHFAECLRAGRLPETHAGDNLKTLRATFAAYQSAAEDRVIPL
jgi:predicted dehydrogenase